MITRILSKMSGALLKAHQYIDFRVKMGDKFQPYIVKYPSEIGTTKIVHVIGNFIVGGSSQLVVDILENTSDKYKHKILTSSLKMPLAYSPLDIQAFGIAEMPQLADWLRREEPELIHIHYFVRESDRYTEGELWYNTVLRICEDLGLRVIQNVNVPTHPHHSSSIVHNIFVSEYVRHEFNNSEVSSSVVYPGSDFKHFRNEQINSLPQKSIGMVYRLDTDKLRDDAIDVFISVARKDREIVSYVVGGGQMLQQFKKKVQEAGLTDRIIFTGYVSYDDLPAVYKKFSIFVAPVHDESFGQVTPFAMSMGQCVVGYETGALPEILGGSETLVPTGEVERLASMIVDFANQPEMRWIRGLANLERAHKLFSVETMVSEYHGLYSRLLKEKASERKSNDKK